MYNGFKTIWLSRRFILFTLTLLICLITHSALAQDPGDIPFSIKIESKVNGFPGDSISFDIIKTGGTEEAHAFDFMIGYDRTKLYGVSVDYGELYTIPGEFEWELLGIDKGPFVECEQGGCPTGLIKITSIAETVNGPHHPIIDPATGKIKVITDNTVLFTINFKIADYLDPAEPFIPVFFFWTLCSDNQIAFTYENDGPYDIRSAFSLSIFDSDGLPGWLEITDYNGQLPTNLGAPDDCFSTKEYERFSDFFNGGMSWGCADINHDGRINILDVIYLINSKYKDGPTPNIPEFADINNDTYINILDIIYLLNYIYKDGPRSVCSQP